MASSAGAEGITLLNVRRVHIMEPHWNPARHDQVIGRAVRICSHAGLPQDQRTVRVSFYLSVFTEDQAKSTEGSNNVVLVRRADMATKRFAGDPVEAFLTTDEYLYNISYEKDITNKRVSTLLKQAAVDCEVHRKLHSRETPVLTCMRFDSTVAGEDLAFKPSIKTDDLDASYLRNRTTKHRRLQKVSIKGMVFLLDPVSREVFDGPAFEDNQRLLRVGDLVTPTQLRWLLP
jgi:environmental stress-induced protein Ves